MKTKVVYTLVSDNSDTYLEQAILSIYSLRIYNKDVVVVLVVDDITDKNIVGNRSEILNFINDKVVVNPPFEYTKVCRSRYIKTNLRRFIQGDYLFIDTDTIICSSLNEIDTCQYDIAAVLDLHLYINEYEVIPHKYRFAKKMYTIHNWQIQDSYPKYFNSGVLFVRDTEKTHLFYELWYQEWLKSKQQGFHVDQPALARANTKIGNIIEELDGVWNCQIMFTGLRYLSKAHIIHYFSNNQNKTDSVKPYLFSNKEIFLKIKEYGKLTNDIKMLLHDPKSLFPKQVLIYSGDYLNLLSSSSFLFLKILFFSHPNIFKIIEKIFSVFRNLHLNKGKKFYRNRW